MSKIPAHRFRETLSRELTDYLAQEAARFPAQERLRVDLHCHDRNSDVPDELWGRLLRLPETWLETPALLKQLQRSGCDLPIITNHNHARSAWELQQKGVDILPAAEFTCHFDEYGLYLHVLAYGFTPEQEVVLERERRDIHRFARYCAEQDIPVILPHPLYFYSHDQQPSLEVFEKLALMFQRFEVVNGHRDVWQSVLTLHWAQSLTPERLAWLAKKHRIQPEDYGVNPDLPKVLTGGSDDHMGLSAGLSGSWLHVPNLAERRKKTPPSLLALEALRDNRIAPFGTVGENQRLGMALLDYFAQAALHMQDPGLLRMALHRGEVSDKLACLAIANGLLELKKHKSVQRFVGCVHDALHGQRPDWMTRWGVGKDYRFCLEALDKVANARQHHADTLPTVVHEAVGTLYQALCKLIAKRVGQLASSSASLQMKDLTSEGLIRHFEIPTQLSVLAFGAADGRNSRTAKALDQLFFPVMVTAVLLGSQIASTRVLFANRPFLNAFAESIGSRRHPRRALYLTDTLRDKNGVSQSLSGKLAEIQRQGYAVDFLICHASAQSEPHLHVVRPIAEFGIPAFGEQKLRIPDVLEVLRIFYAGGYDRVVCSTEGPMAMVALLLKFTFHVPAYFFMHTDWLDFFRHTTALDSHELDRIRRLQRALYHQFDGIFVLNTEHRDWLTHSHMGLDEARIHLTAHHVETSFTTAAPIQKQQLFADATAATPVLFLACRLSREKGIFDLPDIVRLARQQVPDLRVVIAGTGPESEALQAALPDARFMGWVDRATMASLYAGLDLFVFPSRFDTFGNVILEAFSQGMPVIAYRCKGPKDLIQPGINGALVESIHEMADAIAAHFANPQRHASLRAGALRRVQDYQAHPIMQRFLADLGLPTEGEAKADWDLEAA